MKVVKFTDPYGAKRNGVKLKCLECNKDFIARYKERNTRKYCCNKCSNKAKSNKIKVTCSFCGNDVHKPPSKLKNSKSGLYFCNRECKENAQKIGGIEEIQPNHYGTANPALTYRKQFNEKELVCKRCGYDEFSSSVDIHHIDHNRENNNKNNLIPLCSNCHKSLHLNLWELSDL